MTFAHKGLRALPEADRPSGLPQVLVPRICRILGNLDAAASPRPPRGSPPTARTAKPTRAWPQSQDGALATEKLPVTHRRCPECLPSTVSTGLPLARHAALLDQ